MTTVAKMLYWRALRTGPRALADATSSRLRENLGAEAPPHLRASVRRQLLWVAETYDPETDGGLVLQGPTGFGKSSAVLLLLRRLATAAAPGWLDNPTRLPMLWARAQDLPKADLEHGFGSGEAPLVAGATQAEFLVLDDLAWESSRAQADSVVVELLAARYDAGRITLATTGQSPDALRERYGEAVLRRIEQAKGFRGKAINLWPP